MKVSSTDGSFLQTFYSISVDTFSQYSYRVEDADCILRLMNKKKYFYHPILRVSLKNRIRNTPHSKNLYPFPTAYMSYKYIRIR